MPAQRTPWLFEDVHASLSYELEINPQDATMPAIEKTLTPNPIVRGRPVLFQGRNKPQQMELRLTVLTEDQYNTVRYWCSKEKQIRVTDDLGRVFWAYFSNFAPKRVRNAQYPWRHEVNLQCIIVSWE